MDCHNTGLRINEIVFVLGFSDFFFFFFFSFFFIYFRDRFPHNQNFLGSKQTPRYTGQRVILRRVLTRLECNVHYVN